MPQWTLWDLHELFPDLTHSRIHPLVNLPVWVDNSCFSSFFLSFLGILSEFHFMYPSPTYFSIPPYLPSTLSTFPTLPRRGARPIHPGSHHQGQRYCAAQARWGDHSPKDCNQLRRDGSCFSLHIHWLHSKQTICLLGLCAVNLIQVSDCKVERRGSRSWRELSRI